jgi:hypothetical protein
LLSDFLGWVFKHENFKKINRIYISLINFFGGVVVSAQLIDLDVKVLKVSKM